MSHTPNPSHALLESFIQSRSEVLRLVEPVQPRQRCRSEAVVVVIHPVRGTVGAIEPKRAEPLVIPRALPLSA